MKKRILAIAVVIICMSILASVTIAYYTDSATARNVITSGGIDIEVLEQQLVDGELVDYPDEPIPVMPTGEVSKIVSVQSNQQTAWIRANYTITVYDAENKVMQISADELDKVIVIEPDGEKWTEKNGWWYYNTAVETGKMTDPLFEKVAFSGPHMDNRYQGAKVVIDVAAEAVQKANNGETVMDALGWPETN